MCTPKRVSDHGNVKRGVTVDLTMTYSSSYVSGFNTLVVGGVHVSLYQAELELLDGLQAGHEPLARPSDADEALFG